MDVSEIELREEVFKRAGALVDPVVDKHGIETYALGPVFGPHAKSTKIDQHLDHIISVANWLMKE